MKCEAAELRELIADLTNNLSDLEDAPLETALYGHIPDLIRFAFGSYHDHEQLDRVSGDGWVAAKDHGDYAVPDALAKGHTVILLVLLRTLSWLPGNPITKPCRWHEAPEASIFGGPKNDQLFHSPILLVATSPGCAGTCCRSAHGFQLYCHCAHPEQAHTGVIPPHRMKRADVELMQRLHTLVPLVVAIAKSDTMTTEETYTYKNQVSGLLKKHSISTFRFTDGSIKEVEQLHAESFVDTFKPLYGGADGSLPWAVMGADDSQRDAGGWQQLKRDAALKADKEAARRAKAVWPTVPWD
ncbi:hypothetical protein EMIHUDRAFT_217449 [Emiliania huxleyi CCMP1516]|uniref:Septin-type G domain-containing protein n=2 Tax=Emiliania huxleyi TaxID=2903 RepID=A0A0D3IAP6_EMIH1|nr:hypothetical protein EMIHUDRAFT_217449 [Emiliania huxleyi CCMP1516]EOD08331.1 hypothetical protein EMIHUDRAFT_217449 [Emiliania huxleyi CCMP1516]|eukprot:XP_005760760.1 hypothetical protein EMIHUDRAFT_217449 [Emiliania huxleyi CCMP1516]